MIVGVMQLFRLDEDDVARLAGVRRDDVVGLVRCEGVTTRTLRRVEGAMLQLVLDRLDVVYYELSGRVRREGRGIDHASQTRQVIANAPFFCGARESQLERLRREFRRAEEAHDQLADLAFRVTRRADRGRRVRPRMSLSQIDSAHVRFLAKSPAKRFVGWSHRHAPMRGGLNA